jgi:hypothetical protein
MFGKPLPSNNRGVHRQQDDLISLFLFFQNKEIRLKIPQKQLKECHFLFKCSELLENITFTRFSNHKYHGEITLLHAAKPSVWQLHTICCHYIPEMLEILLTMTVL